MVAPTNASKLRSSSSDPLSLLALLAQAQAVNIVADEHCCSWLVDGALRLCGAAVQALLHSLTAQGPGRADQTEPQRPCSAGSM